MSTFCPTTFIQTEGMVPVSQACLLLKIFDLQTYKTLSDRPYLPTFQKEPCPLAATPSLSSLFGIACFPLFSTSQFASSAHHPYSSGTKYFHMHSSSLLLSSSSFKSFISKLLTEVSPHQLRALCYAIHRALNCFHVAGNAVRQLEDFPGIELSTALKQSRDESCFIKNSTPCITSVCIIGSIGPYRSCLGAR